jgi:soluble lytic murein transglycosylase
VAVPVRASAPTLGGGQGSQPAAPQPVAGAAPPSPPADFDPREAAPYFPSNPAAQIERGGAAAAAAWLEGFLASSGPDGADPAAAVADPATAGKRRGATYLLALAEERQGKYSECGRRLADLAPDYALLLPQIAFHAARCFYFARDLDRALTWARRVPASSTAEADARVLEGDILSATARPAVVAQHYSAYLARYPRGPRLSEARARLAKALLALGRRDEATELYRKVWLEDPLSSWADEAARFFAAPARVVRPIKRRGASRGAKGPATPPAVAGESIARNAAEWSVRAGVLFDAQRNAEAEAAYQRALAGGPADPTLTPSLTCHVRYQLAQSVFKQRQRARSSALFSAAEPACAEAKNTDLHMKAMYQAARGQYAAGQYELAAATFLRAEAAHPDHSYADDARLRAGECYAELEDTVRVEQTLATIPERYPTGDLKEEALWRLAWLSWQQGKVDVALQRLEDALRRIPRESIWYTEGRSLYWRARALERLGRMAEALESWQRCVRTYPLSYYALLALNRLRERDPVRAELLLNEVASGASQLAPLRYPQRPLYRGEGFRRALELLRLGLGQAAKDELSDIGLRAVGNSVVVGQSPHQVAGGGTSYAGSAPDPKAVAGGAVAPEPKVPLPNPSGNREELLWLTAELYERAGLWHLSHWIPRTALTSYKYDHPRGGNRRRWELAYPRGFADLITAASQTNGVPVALQLAIVREESAFNPVLESFASAIGLTQLILPTAKRFAAALGFKATRESLQEPRVNVAIGSRYLGMLLGRYAGHPALAVASYNAGEGAVDNWLRGAAGAVADELVERIPYDETRNYTKRVLNSYFVYRFLWDAADRIPAVPQPLPPG